MRTSSRAYLTLLLTAGALSCAAEAKSPRDGWNFKFKDFLIGAWWGPRATDAELRVYRQGGFNVVMAGRYMQLDDYGDPNKLGRELDLAGKHGLAVMLDTYTKNDRPWGGKAGWVEPHRVHHAASVIELKWLHARIGKHPALIGYLLGDDHSGLTRRLIGGTNFLRSSAPHLMPWICQNVANARSLAGNGNPIFNVQIYPTLYRRDLPAAEQARLYCVALAGMRRDSQQLDLIMWPMFNVTRPGRSPSGFAHLESDSLARFPVFASLAYGAQGIWYFTYSGGALQAHGRYRTEPEVRKALTPLYPIARKANLRIAAWGPRLLGRKADRLFSTAWRQRKSLAAESLVRPGAGGLVETMSDDLLVGILTKGGQPPLAMIVDCRGSGKFGDLRPRRVEVRFAESVGGTAVLEGKDRREVRGRTVTLKLEAGGGQLVELKAEQRKR